MPRDYAQIRLTIWNDDDFRKLPPEAQHLYFLLLTHPSLSYSGVADWRPGRLAALSSGTTAGDLTQAAKILSERLYIVIDEATEEVLVRSFIRHDGLMKHARLPVSMTKAFAEVASTSIRGVIVHELKKMHEEAPELAAWTHPAVAQILSCNAVDPADLGPSMAKDSYSDSIAIPSESYPAPMAALAESHRVSETSASVSNLPTTAPATATATLQRELASESRSRPVSVGAAKLSRIYCDKIKLSDRAKVCMVVTNALGADYTDEQIGPALERLADQNMPVTMDTLRIEITGKPGALITGTDGVTRAPDGRPIAGPGWSES